MWFEQCNLCNAHTKTHSNELEMQSMQSKFVDCMWLLMLIYAEILHQFLDIHDNSISNACGHYSRMLHNSSV